MAALGVLGPLLLEDDAGSVRLGSARQRRLLAALAAHLNHPVEVGVLAELVWADDPPADPAGAVQTNVARLRRMLPGGIQLTTTPAGYRLEADRAVVDVTVFADHLAAADATGNPDARRTLLGAALALWRGRPYCELDHPALAPEVARLTELHTSAVERHAEALVAAGRAPDSVAELEALVAAEPLREGAVGLLMRALAAAGRQGDALAAFARLRVRLADELGLDPSPPLRELERRVLRQELTATPAVPVPRAPRPRLPISSFIGREGAVAYVDALLQRYRIVHPVRPGRGREDAAGPARRRRGGGPLRRRRGARRVRRGGPGDVEAILAAALRIADAGTVGADAFADRVVTLLAVRSQLLVLDNCERVADGVAGLVEAICGGAWRVDLLVTSREPLRVDGERVVGVDPLCPDDAAALLLDRIRAADPDPEGAGRASPEVVAEVCRRLDGLPLALELAAARAVPLGLSGLLRELSEPFPALGGGRRTATARHRSLRDVVAWSYGLLDPGQRALFERMAVFAGPVEHAAVAAVCGAVTTLPDLVDRSLVVRRPGDPQTFGMLETLRAFARSRLAADPVAEALGARHATWAARLADEVTADRRAPGEAAAIRRFDTHLADLWRAHSWLCANGPIDELLQLTVPVAELAYLRSRSDLVLLLEETLQVVGLLAADRAAGEFAHPLAARLLGYHAHTLWQRGDLGEAERQARRAIAMACRAGDPTAARDGHDALANALSFRGDLAGARHHAGLALDLARAADDPDAMMTALQDLAVQAAYAGDHRDSRRHEDALAEVVARRGSVNGRALLAYARGECRAERGDPDAARHLHDAVAIAEEADLWFHAGIARHTLLTSQARTATDPAAVLSTFGTLLGYWQSFGAWTQLWIAMRALIEALSRFGRHGDVAVLLGALHASRWASRPFGSDSVRVHTVQVAARAALGPEFRPLYDQGAAMDDARAVALARDLTRSAAGNVNAPLSPVSVG